MSEVSWEVRYENLLDAKRQLLDAGIGPGWDEFNDALTLLAEAPRWKDAPDAPGWHLAQRQNGQCRQFVVTDAKASALCLDTRWFGPIPADVNPSIGKTVMSVGVVAGEAPAPPQEEAS